MCNSRGAYLSSVLVIAITCGHPGNPTNGLTQGNQFNLNDVVKFVCNPGYVAEGAARSQCLASGQWSNVLPTCRSESPFFSSHPAPGPPPTICGLQSRSRNQWIPSWRRLASNGEDLGQRWAINGDFLTP